MTQNPEAIKEKMDSFHLNKLKEKHAKKIKNTISKVKWQLTK